MATEADAQVQESLLMIQNVLRIAIVDQLSGKSASAIASMMQIEESDASETILPPIPPNETVDYRAALVKYLSDVMRDYMQMQKLDSASKLISNMTKLIKNLGKMPKEIANHLISGVMKTAAADEKALVLCATGIYFGQVSQEYFNRFLKTYNVLSNWNSHMMERDEEIKKLSDEWLKRNPEKVQGHDSNSKTPIHRISYHSKRSTSD